MPAGKAAQRAVPPTSPYDGVITSTHHWPACMGRAALEVSARGSARYPVVVILLVAAYGARGGDEPRTAHDNATPPVKPTPAFAARPSYDDGIDA